MADQRAIRAALGRLGFSAAASTFIVDNQGMDTLDEFKILKDTEVEDLCKVVRRPGGTIPNPNPAVGQPQEIPNPGINVTLRASNNLKLMCYFLRFKERTSRPVTAADITLDNIRALRDHKTWEESHEDVTAPELSFKDWPRTIEALEEYLRGCLGTTKLPLAYIVREDIDVPNSANDPSANYATLGAELIARAPHVTGAIPPVHTAAYLKDRETVWQKIADLTRDHECWTYVRPAQRSRDGRAAFLGLKEHYLGASNVDNMASKAESKLNQAVYQGENRRWNFEKFVRLHVDQHAILEGLKDQGYAGIDERSKVRILLSGVKTKELDTVKTQILASAQLRNDFARCVNLFQDFINQSTSNNLRTSNVSALTRTKSTKNKDSDDNIEPGMSVELRYYNRDEYKSLTAEKKKGLRLKRARRNGTNKGGGKADGKNKRKPELTQRDIKALKRLARDSNGKAADNSSDEDEEVAMKPPSSKGNRNNKALQRKKDKNDE
jgi:hypothetical protein